MFYSLKVAQNGQTEFFIALNKTMHCIPVNILKLIKNIISVLLEIIFNSSLLNGIVPDSPKIARVIPIHKKESTLSLNNYRPISLLSVFNKITA